MRMTLTILALLALGACQAGCASMGLGGAGGSGGTDWAKAAVEIAKDPACTHTDILDIMLGPVPSGHVHLERSGCKTGLPPAAKAVPLSQIDKVMPPPAS